MRKKGQFFIISAVVVVILLMSITNMLSTKDHQDSSIHLRDLNDALRVLENNNYELSELMSILSDDTIYAVLDAYLIKKKALLSTRGYLMIYNINESENTIKITYDINSIHMEQTIPIQKFSRISAWDFDEGVGVVAKDKTNSNDGELINFSDSTNSGWTDNCISGNCLVFDGIDDYVLIPTISEISLLKNFTVAGWLKFINVSTQQVIMHHGNSPNSFVVSLVSNTLGMGMYNGSDWLGHTQSLNMLNDSTWYFFTYVHYNDDSSKLYVNGMIQTAGGGSSLTLGSSRFGNTGGDYPFNGTIDNVRIYNQSLTEEQVQFLYSNDRN